MSWRRRLIPLTFLTLVLLLGVFSRPGPMMASGTDAKDSAEDVRMVELDDGTIIPVGPDEELHKFVLTDQGWTEWTGESSELTGAEFGNSSNSFPDRQMKYLPTNTTTDDTVEVSTGTDWDAYYVRADIIDLTENRTWTEHPDFTDDSSDWTLGTVGGAGSSLPISDWNASGHGLNDDCLHFEIDSQSPGTTYWYDANDRAYAQQTMNILRGDVVWSGLRLDYWADTEDDSHYGMTGSFSIYVDVEGTRVWELVFDAIPAEETWYDSGLVTVPTSVYNLPADQNVFMEIGLLSHESVGYAPEIAPNARMDNVELYVKTRATPTSVNLEMNGQAVVNNAGYGSGYITETPATPWSIDPVKLNFSWIPTPVNPDPNRTIIIDFDIDTEMYARRTDVATVSEINPTAYGERFSIQNGSDAYYSSYFYANIPDGYVNRYFFNLSLPSSRDVFFVARPLAPSTNLTSGWTGGEPGDEYLNVSAFDVTTEAGRYGYWRMRSSSQNMISDLEMWDPSSSTWESTVGLRAGNSTRVRAYVGASFLNSVVNITIFDPDGSSWHSVNATVDGTGYATTSFIAFDGSSASAGSWMVQAFCNDVGTNTLWRSTGFFKRPFTVTHTSDLVLTHPSEAVGTWLANVTFGDLLLVIIKANDTDSSVLVPGGILELDWVLGKDTFDDSGNGQYTKVIDTSLLPGKGQYTMDLEWSNDAFDNATAQLTLIVNYATSLTSSDYPGISGPVGYDQSFVVDFANVNGTGIANANLICNWSGPYTVTPLGAGSYEFDLDLTGIVIGEYPITVSASGSYLEPTSMLMYVEVREVYNTVSYSANQLSIPVGEAASFTITWTDVDNSVPITSGASYISCNWTPFHSAGEQNYTIVETVAGVSGVYNVTIYTESDDPLTTIGEFYTVTFNVMRKDYQNHTFNIGVQIRSHNTLFILDEPIQQTLIGETIIVLVYYMDTDLGEGITNSSTLVHLSITTPGIANLQFTVGASSYGTGHYNISIPSSQWGYIGWKNLSLFIEWTGPVTKYYSKTIDTSVRILGTDTDLYLEQAPTATYFLNNVSFTTVYYDAINATRISDPANVHISITPITGGHPVTQNDFYIIELISTPGTYMFELNTSLFQDVGTFRFEIAFMWTNGVSPHYENRTMTVTLHVIERPTYVDYTPVASTPYGEIAEFSFTFIDALSTSRIEASIQLTISLSEGSVDYTMAYDSVERIWTLSIDTATLPAIGANTLHLNLGWAGEPYYASISAQPFVVTVTLRSTQLTHLSFAPGQWGNNVSIEFIYTDLVSGSSAGMTGDLTLNASLAGWYSVVSLGNGHYLIVLNTSAFASDGTYALEATIVYTGTYNAADAVEVFMFSVLKRSTQLGYDSPDPAPYLENVTFVISFTDDSTGIGISGASVIVDCANSSSTPLVLNTHYWVTDIGGGYYRIEVDSQALGSVAAYVLDVDVSWTGAPYYLPASIEVNSRVVQRSTQILITQTPGDTQFLENITFEFKFEDFLSGASIAIDKSHITLTHGIGMTLIPANSYVLIDYGTYYEIGFNSTVLNPSALVTLEEIQLSIDKSAGVPFYALRSTTTKATTVERQTQILFPLVQETPYLDNITINLQYTDYLTGEGVSGANLAITSPNRTPVLYQLYDVGDGSYILLINTTQFGDSGSVYFTFTLSKSGIPFYASRVATDVPAVIRDIQTSLLSEAPAPGSTAVGTPITVVMTFQDFDHDVPIEGATIETSWSWTSQQIVEIGNGVYHITINTTGLLAQAYVFTVEATKAHYAFSNVSVIIQPGASTVNILLGSTTYYSSWGETAFIDFDVQEPYYLTLVPGMNVSILWNGSLYYGYGFGNGSYVVEIPTSDMNFGIFDPQITVTAEFYQPRHRSFILIVNKATAQVLTDDTTINVVFAESESFWVYLNDTVSNAPVDAASVTMEWNNTVYPLAFNGTAGFYEGQIDSLDFSIGPYELIVRAVAMNHVFLDFPFDVNVVPIPAEVQVAGVPQLTVYYGDMFYFGVVYNDTYHLVSIDGANVTYTLGSIYGVLVQDVDGAYRGSIDTTALAAQTIYLRIVATQGNYSTVTRNFILSILPIPTEAMVDDSLRVGFRGEEVTFTLQLNDTYHDMLIPGAVVHVSWEGGSAISIDDLGNGTYVVVLALNLTQPRTYDVDIMFTLQNYQAASIKVNVEIKATEATIQGPDSISVPVNDTAMVEFMLWDTVNELQITTINGFASWALGDVSLELENGNYTLEVPGNLPTGIYDITIYCVTSTYSIENKMFRLEVRNVHTAYTTINQTILTTPGANLMIPVSYFDVDHGVGLSGVTPIVSYDQDLIIYFEDQTYEPFNNGTYHLYFQVTGAYTFDVVITFARNQYDSQVVTFQIQSDITPQQALQQLLGYVGGGILAIFAVLLVVYVKVWSIPWIIRVINKMLAVLAAGKIPAPAKVRTRADIILEITNEELQPTGIEKTIEDVTGESIVTVVPEVDELLEKLASITGLGEVEVAAFRADLSRMKASERPGFIREVIEQEEARRADTLTAGKLEEEPKIVAPEVLGDLPEELDELRKKLQQKGMGTDEIEIIVEQAKNLSRADLEALLDSLGIRL
ncbi:MAG: hypothetical protein RTU09_06190 [Candidatus Thorarchaeota archaeon]